MKRLALLLAVLSITLFAGCRTVAVIPVSTHATVTHTRHILPPHAPAHGYRQHHHDYDLEYDSDFGAYVVLGYDGIYFYNNLYLRFYDGYWQTTPRLNSTWHHAEHRHIPDRLRGHRRYNRQHRNSPPSHAPAHGYRQQHHDVDMIFDSGVGAYIVLGFDNLFFFNNNYMRFYDGYWHYSERHNGRWHRANDRHVPHKLRKARKHNKHGLFGKLKKRYQKEHREHRKNREHRNSRGRHQSENGRNSKRQQNGGLFQRTKDRHQNRRQETNESRERHEVTESQEPRKSRTGGLFRTIKNQPQKKAQEKRESRKKYKDKKKDKKHKKSKKNDKKKKHNKDENENESEGENNSRDSNNNHERQRDRRNDHQ
ncbi:MAG: hypothetical protein V3R49_05460 [Gammaproteobacteria bacterium]